MSLLSVYGDSYADGYGEVGRGPGNFCSILAANLQADLANWAISGTGYANPGSGNGVTFTAQVNTHASAATTTALFFGSLNDAAYPAGTVGANATTAFNKIKAVSPSAQIVVVGPQYPTAARPTGLAAASSALHTAATAAGALWIDPLTPGWFDTRFDLLGNDAFHPSTAGHRHIARLISTAMGVLPTNRPAVYA